MCVSTVCEVFKKWLDSLWEISSLESHFLAFVNFMALSFASYCLLFLYEGNE